jgi:glycosyltransferase involved in cell wall biosynthesis
MSTTIVALVTPRYPPAIGGIERTVANLARRLARRGFGVEVVTTDPTGQLPSVEEDDGVVVRRFPTVAGDSVYFVAPELGSWLWRNAARFGLIHAHSYHTPLALQAALAARRASVPLLLSPYYHGTGHSLARRALHLPYRPLAGWLVRRAERMVYISETERALLERRHGTPRSHVVAPCGVEVERVRGGVMPAAAYRRRTILAVGRLESYKQTDRLVAALPYLPPEYEVVVIGSGPLRPRLEQLADRLGERERLRLLDHVSQQELSAWYRCADAFVSLSRHESFGLTVLEGAASGAPAVVSDIPAHREVAGYLPEGRVLFAAERFGAADLAHLVQEAVRCGRAGDTTGWELPTWDAMADTVAAAYADVLETRRGRLVAAVAGDSSF